MHLVAEKACTPEDLPSMPDGKDHQLVDGHLVERNLGPSSSWVGGRMYRLLATQADDRTQGRVWPSDLGDECDPDAPNEVRKPDVSSLRIDRMPGGPTSGGSSHLSIFPPRPQPQEPRTAV